MVIKEPGGGGGGIKSGRCGGRVSKNRVPATGEEQKLEKSSSALSPVPRQPGESRGLLTALPG